MTRKKRKKHVQQKSIHEFITKRTLTSPTTQPTMKMINRNDTPQQRSLTDSNDTSTASCALQIDKGNVTKELILDPSYLRLFRGSYILPTKSTEIKNGVDFCQGDNPEQESMKTDTDTKDPNRFNPQQKTDDNRNIQFEKRNGKSFTRSYRMNLPRTA